MKIENLKTSLVRLPFDKKIGTAIHHIDSIGCVCLELATDSGLVGEGLLFTINAERLLAFDEMLRGLSPLVLGQDPHYHAKITRDIWAAINPTGHKGVTISAMSAIDCALWDLVAKHAKLPLANVFGRVRDQIPCYASSGLWLSQTIDELQECAQDLIEQGFKSLKVRLGSGSIEDDLKRVKAVRETVGDAIEILCDANQAFRPKSAIRLANALQDLGVKWLEEPVFYGDLEGHRQVRDAVEVDIATGETEYSLLGMKAILDAKACDVLMPDLQRAGGFSQMLAIANLAKAYHVPISTHIFTEYSLSIAGHSDNCMSVEHMPWFTPLFLEEMHLENGQLKIPKAPGHGFNFDEGILREFAL